MSSKGARYRRNGKLQACEPCRKHKIKCDHELPVCGRCKRRKLNAECIYHPAPLTRPASSPASMSWRSSETFSSGPVSTPTTNSSIAAILNDPDPVPGTQDTAVSVDADAVPGFLGSTSFSEVWKAAGHASDKAWLGSLSNFRKTLRTHSAYRLSAERIDGGIKVLKLLRDAPAVKTIIRSYHEISTIVVCPWVTMEKCIDAIEREVQGCKSDAEWKALSTKIFRQTFVPLRVDENTTAENFHLLCTGPKLRWEIIGLIVVYYNMGCMVDEVNEHKIELEARGGTKLLLELTHASNMCVNFCDRAESLNDMLIWLIHSNALLLMFMYGETSHLAWHRIGDLASSIFAMGLHQEPSINNKIPFFIQELRRHVFANAYSSDKALSTFLGRPPRLSKRYCSVRPPHDLTEDEMIAPPEIRELALSKLDADGWNVDRRLGRSTWGRIKLWVNFIREETLELSLGIPRSDDEQRRKAQSILDRAKAGYASLPSWARYSPDIWWSGVPNVHCFSLLAYYLHSKYSEFLLQRIFQKHGGSNAHEVFETASRLLSATLDISTYRDRIGKLSKDFAWIAIFYGLPPSALLGVELLRQQQSSNVENSTQIRLPRAEIIRNISVFVSSLEWVAKPDDGNYELCQGAKVLLESILNAILDSNPASSSEQIPQPAPEDPVMWLDDMFASGWMTQGNFVDSLAADSNQSWEPLGNWTFEF